MFWNKTRMEEIVKNALCEDLADGGDITSHNLFSSKKRIKGYINAREEGILAGLNIAAETFQQCSKEIKFTSQKEEGAILKAGEIIAEIEGLARDILCAERTALNFLQRLSGIATRTGQYVKVVEDFNVRITDTRKTTPTLRMLEKYAVRMGGGHNHRFGLFDGAMIKDNHIIAAGGIKQAVKKLKQKLPHTVKIEVEVEDLQEVREALAAGADIIMLDNMEPELIAEAVELIAGRAIVEASGGITLDSLKEVARTGVDVISVGALTHQINSLDIGLDFE